MAENREINPNAIEALVAFLQHIGALNELYVTPENTFGPSVRGEFTPEDKTARINYDWDVDEHSSPVVSAIMHELLHSLLGAQGTTGSRTENLFQQLGDRDVFDKMLAPEPVRPSHWGAGQVESPFLNLRPMGGPGDYAYSRDEDVKKSAWKASKKAGESFSKGEGKTYSGSTPEEYIKGNAPSEETQVYSIANPYGEKPLDVRALGLLLRDRGVPWQVIDALLPMLNKQTEGGAMK